MEPTARGFQSASFLMNLPRELISMIYNYLEVKDIGRQNLVCTRARDIATDLLLKRLDAPFDPAEDPTKAFERLKIKAALQFSKIKRKSSMDLLDLVSLQWTLNELEEANRRLENGPNRILSMVREISA